MTNQPIHILNQMGIISSFSIAKKVTKDDINKFFTKYKRIGKKTSEIEKILKGKIFEDIQNAIVKHEIPGLLSSQEIAKEMGMDKDIVENIPELNRFLMIITQKLSEKHHSKMILCYIINSLVNILGLTENDFEKFHRNNSNDDDDDDDDEESVK